MIRKQELIDAISDLNHDLLLLSLRVGDLENELLVLKQQVTKPVKSEKVPVRRGRPSKNTKK